MNFFMEVAKLRAARLLWAKLVAQFEPKNAEVAVAAHALADLGLVAHRAGRVQQRRPHLHRGDGRDPGPHPVAAHQRAGRGARAADRLLGPDRPQHPAAAAAGVRHDPGHRPVGRLRTTSSGSPTTWPRRAWEHIQEVEPAGGMAKAIDAGHARSCASRRPPPAPRPASTPGRQPVIGVNKYRLAEEDAARRAQGRQRRRSRAAAGGEAATGCGPSATRRRRGAALDALTAAPADGAASGNLLALAIDAARAKATVGEISDALEKVYGRHAREIRTISGVYRDGGRRRRGARSSRRGAADGRVRARRRAAGRASWSPRWARTATTAARR